MDSWFEASRVWFSRLCQVLSDGYDQVQTYGASILHVRALTCRSNIPMQRMSAASLNPWVIVDAINEVLCAQITAQNDRLCPDCYVQV